MGDRYIWAAGLLSPLVAGAANANAEPVSPSIPEMWQQVDELGVIDEVQLQQIRRRQALSMEKGPTHLQAEFSDRPGWGQEKITPKPEPPKVVGGHTVPTITPLSPKEKFRQDWEALERSRTVPKPQPVSHEPLPQAMPDPVLRPASNAQLYEQKTLALRSGILSTRIPGQQFHGQWSKATRQPTYQDWKNITAQEARVVAKSQGGNRLGILVGDSLTMWFPSDLLPKNKLWLNQGISGENSGQISQRLHAFSQTRPDTIYVMAGINDLKQGKSDQEILRNTRALLQTLRRDHPQALIVLQSILPTRNQGIDNQRIQRLNNHIEWIAKQEQVGFLNLYGLFSDRQGNLRPELTTDGLHLNGAGYEVWQRGILEVENHDHSRIAAHGM